MYLKNSHDTCNPKRKKEKDRSRINNQIVRYRSTNLTLRIVITQGHTRAAIRFPRSKKLRSLAWSESDPWHWRCSSDRRVVFHRPFPPKRIAATSAATRSSLSARGGESSMGSFCPLPYRLAAHAHNLFLSMWKRSFAAAKSNLTRVELTLVIEYHSSLIVRI